MDESKRVLCEIERAKRTDLVGLKWSLVVRSLGEYLSWVLLTIQMLDCKA